MPPVCQSHNYWLSPQPVTSSCRITISFYSVFLEVWNISTMLYLIILDSWVLDAPLFLDWIINAFMPRHPILNYHTDDSTFFKITLDLWSNSGNTSERVGVSILENIIPINLFFKKMLLLAVCCQKVRTVMKWLKERVSITLHHGKEETLRWSYLDCMDPISFNQIKLYVVSSYKKDCFMPEIISFVGRY